VFPPCLPSPGPLYSSKSVPGQVSHAHSVSPLPYSHVLVWRLDNTTAFPCIKVWFKDFMGVCLFRPPLPRIPPCPFILRAEWLAEPNGQLHHGPGSLCFSHSKNSSGCCMPEFCGGGFFPRSSPFRARSLLCRLREEKRTKGNGNRRGSLLSRSVDSRGCETQTLAHGHGGGERDSVGATLCRSHSPCLCPWASGWCEVRLVLTPRSRLEGVSLVRAGKGRAAGGWMELQSCNGRPTPG